MTPYEVLYGVLPPIHIPYFPRDSTVESVDAYLTTKENLIKRVRSHLQTAQHRMTTIANKRRSDRSFEVKDYVYLKLQPYRQQSTAVRVSHKLAAKYYGPYQVLAKVGTVAYMLNLPPSSMIHPVFHVSQLKKHVGNQIVQQTLPAPQPTPYLHPRAILDRRLARQNHKATTQVLVHWEGLPPANATWEFTDELSMRFPSFNLEDKVGFKEGRLLPTEVGEEED